MQAAGQELFTIAGPPYFTGNGGVNMDNGGVSDFGDPVQLNRQFGTTSKEETEEFGAVVLPTERPLFGDGFEVSNHVFGGGDVANLKVSTTKKPRMRLRKKVKVRRVNTTPTPTTPHPFLSGNSKNSPDASHFQIF